MSSGLNVGGSIEKIDSESLRGVISFMHCDRAKATIGRTAGLGASGNRIATRRFGDQSGLAQI